MYLLQIDDNKLAHDTNLPIDSTNNLKVDRTDINCLFKSLKFPWTFISDIISGK
jgi:hypothetical protein